jgi:HK97 family phage major capsid protein
MEITTEQIVGAIKSEITPALENVKLENTNLKTQLTALNGELDVVKTSLKEIDTKLQDEVKSKITFGANDSKYTDNDKLLGFAKFIALSAKGIREQTVSSRQDLVKMFENKRSENALNSFAYDLATKSLSISTFADGSALVGEDTYSQILPILFQNSILDKLSPMRVPMPRGSMSIPYDTADSQLPEYVGLQTGGNNILPAQFGKYQMQSKIVKGVVPIGNELIDYADYQVLPYIITKLQETITRMIDSDLFYGAGTEYKLKGIYTQMLSGNKFNSAGTTLTQVKQDIVKALQRVSAGMKQNENVNAMVWVMSARTYYYMLTLETTTNAEARLVEELKGGTLYGKKVIVSNTILDTFGGGSNRSQIWLGDWSQLMLGIEKQLQITVDRDDAYRDANGNIILGKDTNETVIRLESRMDSFLSRQGAFAVIEDVAYSIA